MTAPSDISLTVATVAPSDPTVWDGSIDTSWYNTTGTVFTLETAAQFAGFAAIVNNKPESSDAGAVTGTNAALPADDFAGKTVKLTTDLDLGGIEVTSGSLTGTVYTRPVWEGQEWVPIATYTSSSPSSAGVKERPFKGTFDGFHTISNIYVPNPGNGNDTYTANSHALFGELGQTGVVKNVVIGSGYIRGGRYTAGVVGRNWGQIENCANYATIETDGDRSGGGIVGASYNNSGNAWIINSYNAGLIMKGDQRYSGGIAGDNEGLIKNCYNIGTGMNKSTYALMGGILGGGHANSGSITNCYSLIGNGLPTAIVATNNFIPASCAMLADAEMKTYSFVATLNNGGGAFAPRTADYPYPVLNASGDPFVLTGIEITTSPSKTEYTAGDTLDMTDMVVTATFTGDKAEVVTGYTITPSGALAASDKSVTISYTVGGETKTTTQAITVSAMKAPDPAQPTADDVTATSFKITNIYNTATYGNLEYQIKTSDGDWGTSWAVYDDDTGITGLTPNTEYSVHVRYAGISNQYSAGNPSDEVSITTLKAELNGIVTISGNAVYGQTLTAVTTSLSSDPSGVALGTLTYQWKRDDVDISGATNETYMLVAADIDAAINVTVSAANCNGSVSSTNEEPVAKANQNPPTLAYTITGDYEDDGTKTITKVDGAEYKFGNDEWGSVNEYVSTEEELIWLYIRMKGTTTHNASNASSQEINTAYADQDSPADFTLEVEADESDMTYTITIPATDGAEYSFNGEDWNDKNTKTDCHPGETITGYKRMAATPGVNPSNTVSDRVTLPLFTVKTPTAYPNGGSFTDNQSVTLDCDTAGAAIYYTTDGTAPNTGSTPYNGEFTVMETTTVKAIAVKEGMDDSVVLTVTFTKAAPKSSDATLSALTISSGTLSPAFNPDTTSYTATVANSVGSVTVTAIANDSNATISGAGTRTLNTGANVITIAVTAEDGMTSKVCTLTITRAAASSGSGSGSSSGSSSSGSGKGDGSTTVISESKTPTAAATDVISGSVVATTEVTSTVTNDTASATVSSSALTSALDKAVDAAKLEENAGLAIVVEVKLTDLPSTATAAEVTAPASAVKSIADTPDASLEIPIGTMPPL